MQTFQGQTYQSLAHNDQQTQLYELENVSSTTKISHRSANDPMLDPGRHSSESIGHGPKASLWHRFMGHLSGWRFGVATAGLLIGITLIINFSFLMWAKSNFPTEDGLGTLRRGNCKQLEQANTWIHVAINILSTAMLGGSNYSMQRLSAPTRNEIDKAHASKLWLDIGVLSTRNLRSISLQRSILWAILALSSVPIHLLYNSAIFTQIGGSVYDVHLVSEKFVTQTPEEVAKFYNTTHAPKNVTTAIKAKLQDPSKKWEHLSVEDCVKSYAVPIVTAWSDVLVVSNDTSSSYVEKYSGVGGKTVVDHPGIPSFGWICEGRPIDVTKCTRELVLGSKPVTIQGKFPSYCLAQRITEQCELKFSVGILVTVILCNLVKLLCMVLNIWMITNQTLVTLGDAVSSFLQNPDPTTRGICLASKHSVGVVKKKFAAPLQWTEKRRYWFRAASPTRWGFTNAFCIIGIVIPTMLFSVGLESLKENKIDVSTGSIKALGFGAVNTQTIVQNGPTRWAESVLLANLPQLLLSMVYVTYNSIYTCGYLSYEWNQFGIKRKPLRVTIPSEGQLSTYYLTLPYSCGVPLLIISALLHWLFSQALFLVDIRYNRVLTDSGDRLTRLGYSPLATIISIVVASVVTVVGIAFGFRKFAPGIPLAGTCSVAISAACHAREDEVPSLAFKPVQWGVVSVGREAPHCSFSSRPVGQPNTRYQYK